MRILFAAAALLLPLSATAQTREDEQVWLNLTAMGPVKGDIVYFGELQPRTGEGVSRLDALLLRGAVGIKLSKKVTLYQGYAHVVTPVDGGRDRNEERSFQQISWNIGTPLGGELSSRTRLEQRWRNDGRGMGWRAREMLRYEMPLREDRQGPNGLVYSEVFVALNDTDWGARKGFDQIRNFAGLEIPVGGKSTIEAGYLNQVIDQGSGRRRVNHVAALSLWLRR